MSSVQLRSNTALAQHHLSTKYFVTRFHQCTTCTVDSRVICEHWTKNIVQENNARWWRKYKSLLMQFPLDQYCIKAQKTI